MISSDNIKLSRPGSITCNATDAKGHERGKPCVKGGKRPALIYSVTAIEDGVAVCESKNVCTFEHYHERIPATNLEPWSPPARG